MQNLSNTTAVNDAKTFVELKYGKPTDINGFVRLAIWAYKLPIEVLIEVHDRECARLGPLLPPEPGVPDNKGIIMLRLRNTVVTPYFIYEMLLKELVKYHANN